MNQVSTPSTKDVRHDYVYGCLPQGNVTVRDWESAKRRIGGGFDAWLVTVKADAWSRGHDAGEHDRLDGDGAATPNPYR